MIEYKYGDECPIEFRKVTKADEALLSDFQCENDAIRKFIRCESIESQENVSYLFVDINNNIIIGFCSICCTGISTIEYDIDEQPYDTSLPAVEINFFAIDNRYQKLAFDCESSRYETLSAMLFLRMLKHIFDIASDVVGATHICLYSVPQAVNFYKRCGFSLFEEYMRSDEKPFLNGCIPMFLAIPTDV